MAFFPCIRFEDQITLHMRCDCGTMRKWNDIKKLEYSKRMQKEVTDNFEIISNLVIVCLRKNLKLIIENPKSPQHYLSRYWCLKPSLIDKDRTTRGDYFKKPTQYWFINFEPKHNFIFEALARNGLGASMTKMKKQHYAKMGAKSEKVARSMIHPDYANRFIREFILDGETNESM